MNNAYKILPVFVALLAGLELCSPVVVSAQPEQLTIRADEGPAAAELLRWREVFIYEVKYSFFKLGEVRVEVTDTLYNGEPAWRLTGIITSAPGIPFVGREENHYSSIFRIEDGRPKELVYWKDDVDDENMNEDRYIFDYGLQKVYAFREGEVLDTLDLERPATSGPLVFIFSRRLAGEGTTSRTYIYLDEKKGILDMEHTRRMENREYDAFEQPVTGFYSEGDANFDGPFGFRGNFKAWFAIDSLRIPLEAHVKVWLGNVKVRLIDYQKELRNEESSF